MWAVTMATSVDTELQAFMEAEGRSERSTEAKLGSTPDGKSSGGGGSGLSQPRVRAELEAFVDAEGTNPRIDGKARSTIREDGPSSAFIDPAKIDLAEADELVSQMLSGGAAHGALSPAPASPPAPSGERLRALLAENRLSRYWRNFADRGLLHLRDFADLVVSDYSTFGVTELEDRQSLYQLVQRAKETVKYVPDTPAVIGASRAPRRRAAPIECTNVFNASDGSAYNPGARSTSASRGVGSRRVAPFGSRNKQTGETDRKSRGAASDDAAAAIIADAENNHARRYKDWKTGLRGDKKSIPGKKAKPRAGARIKSFKRDPDGRAKGYSKIVERLRRGRAERNRVKEHFTNQDRRWRANYEQRQRSRLQQKSASVNERGSTTSAASRPNFLKPTASMKRRARRPRRAAEAKTSVGGGSQYPTPQSTLRQPGETGLVATPARQTPVLVYLDVEIGDGRRGRVGIRRGADPRLIAENFIEAYSLPQAAAPKLEALISAAAASASSGATEGGGTAQQ